MCYFVLNMIQKNSDYIIRNYQPEDRGAVRYICSETGFLGDPQEIIVEDREAFADLWSMYWTDWEPYSVFVAEREGRVVGYILGCLDSERQERISKKEIALPLLRKALIRGFFIKPKNIAFIARMVRSLLRREFNIPMDRFKREYPAHLHINIADPGLRGKGVGWCLMKKYIDYLKEKGVRGVHLCTTSHNKQAIPFYHRCGFELVFKTRFSAYDHAVADPPVFQMIFAMTL